MSLQERSTNAVPDENTVPNRKPVNVKKIYVYGDIDGDQAGKQVKIGITGQEGGKRKSQHEKRGPNLVRMRWLVGVWGHQSDERALISYWTQRGLHHGISDNRIHRTEWFIANTEMRDWLRWLRDQPFASVTEDGMDHVEVVSDSRLWLPDGEKNKKKIAQLHLPMNGYTRDPWDDLDTAEIMDGDYYTHELMIDAAHESMGGIDLDPASCRTANCGVLGYKGVRAKTFFGLREDGLLQKWHGNVWLNPPFGQWDSWAPKALNEWRRNNLKQMCVFCTASASTSHNFHDLLSEADAVFLPRGRFGCWGPKASTARDGNFIFYFGRNIDAFKAAYEKYGTVFVKYVTASQAQTDPLAAKELGAMDGM